MSLKGALGSHTWYLPTAGGVPLSTSAGGLWGLGMFTERLLWTQHCRIPFIGYKHIFLSSRWGYTCWASSVAFLVIGLLWDPSVPGSTHPTIWACQGSQLGFQGFQFLWLSPLVGHRETLLQRETMELSPPPPPPPHTHPPNLRFILELTTKGCPLTASPQGRRWFGSFSDTPHLTGLTGGKHPCISLQGGPSRQ